MKKILLTGGNGQLGRTLKEIIPKLLENKNFELIAPDKNKFNLSNCEECKKYIEQLDPHYLINCAAFTNVEAAEDYELEAIKVNSKAPSIFAKTLNKNGGYLIHISTDYVFDGTQTKPYIPIDKKKPLSVYGKSKSYGEDLIIKNFSNENQYTILRTSWLISPYGENFVKKIINLLCTKNYSEPLKVIYDQIGSTTSVNTLSETIYKIIYLKEKKFFIPNILHWSDSGEVSWYEVALAIREILYELGYEKRLKEIIKISSDKYSLKAERPKYSLLDTKKTEQILGIKR